MGMLDNVNTERRKNSNMNIHTSNPAMNIISDLLKLEQRISIGSQHSECESLNVTGEIKQSEKNYQLFD
jgi:hypothetical protein